MINMRLNLPFLFTTLLFVLSSAYMTLEAHTTSKTINDVIEKLKKDEKPITAYQIEKVLKINSTDPPIVFDTYNVTTSKYSGKIDVAALTATTFVIAYRGANVGVTQIGTIDPLTGTITYGAAASTSGTAASGSYASVDALSSTSFILTYRQGTDSQANIGTVSGTTINLGNPITVTSINTSYQEVVVLSATSCVFTYKDGSGSPYSSYVVAGTISGNNISLGTPTEILTTGLSKLFLEKLDATSFVIAGSYYNSGQNDASVHVGIVSGNSISLGTDYGFAGAADLSISTLDANTFVLFWENNSIIEAKVGTITGTAISYGAVQSVPMSRDQATFPKTGKITTSSVALIYLDATVEITSHPFFGTQTTILESKVKVITADISGTTLSFSDSTNTTIPYNLLREGAVKSIGDGFVTTHGNDNSANAFYGEPGVVLPVELITFTANAQENQTHLLKWQTASEENNAAFEIEKSADGQSWERIGTVEGNGTTIFASNYSFVDENPLNGMNYYRLKQIDFDGQFEYSEVELVKQSLLNDKAVVLYPNPVQDNLTIENGEGLATIYNVLGQPIRAFSIFNSQSSIDVSDLSKGHYLLKITKTNGTIVSQPFVK